MKALLTILAELVEEARVALVFQEFDLLQQWRH
jgi:hypothetical protein